MHVRLHDDSLSECIQSKAAHVSDSKCWFYGLPSHTHTSHTRYVTIVVHMLRSTALHIHTHIGIRLRFTIWHSTKLMMLRIPHAHAYRINMPLSSVCLARVVVVLPHFSSSRRCTHSLSCVLVGSAWVLKTLRRSFSHSQNFQSDESSRGMQKNRLLFFFLLFVPAV